MLTDYDVQRCTRHCAATGRELKPGETFYAALIVEGANLVRHDYATEAWPGPPEGALGWWKSIVPSSDTKRTHWAPNDVMLDLFEQLESQPARHDFRYVLALLLIRRRVLRLEETEHDAAGHEVLLLSCPKRETDYRVTVVMPDEKREKEIQAEVQQLLTAKG